MKPLISISCRTAKDTSELGAELARHFCMGDCVTLSGPLGVGKSELARAAVRAHLAEPDVDVPSPTFTLVQYYDASTPLVHADLYRTEVPDEWDELGIEEVIDVGVALIEWPERAPSKLPKARLDIVGRLMPDKTRIWCFWGADDWRDRLHGWGKG